MLLLITDTSGKNGTVALARLHDGASELDIVEEVPLAGGTFSAQLVPQIAALLAQHGFNKSQIDASVVVSGPGSFTGLRVGLAAVKGLAEILGKPIVPVSLLEVVARASGVKGKVFSVLDAGRREIYLGEYEAGDSTRTVREQLLSSEDVARATKGMAVVTPDAALVDFARESGSVWTLVTLNSAAIARLGLEKLRAGQVSTPEQLDANYIRHTDAEIFINPPKHV